MDARSDRDYGTTVVFAGLTHVSRYRTEWLSNFYKVHRDAVSWKGSPYAFVVPAAQRDPLATYELVDILRTGAVEIHRARAPFTADGRTFPAGSYVVKVAQPYGPFAKTLLEKQVYPDLRLFPGGPPKPPYDVTTQTLGYLLGVDVVVVERSFEAPLDLVTTLGPQPSPFPDPPRWAYVVGPESNAGFIAVARLQKAGVPLFRAGDEVSVGGRTVPPGAWIVPAGADARRILEGVSRETGLEVLAANEPLAVSGFRLKPSTTRIGLWRGANNMPGGWLLWTFEQYGINQQVVSSADFSGDLSAKYDAIVLPGGITRETIVNGLDRTRNDSSWAWAYGVGDAGWAKLAQWVRDGGTLVAVGDSVETARALLDLPIAKALPEARRRRGFGAAAATDERVPASAVTRALKDAFSSPAALAATLRDRVVEPESLFYCPGSLLQNDFDIRHPVAFGLPASWPVFFESDQAYRLSTSFGIRSEVVARYPASGQILKSGWLLGEDLLRDQANVVAFHVGRGYVVTLATQVAFRAQARATYKLLFNALFHGPSTPVTAAELARLEGSKGGTQ